MESAQEMPSFQSACSRLNSLLTDANRLAQMSEDIRSHLCGSSPTAVEKEPSPTQAGAIYEMHDLLNRMTAAWKRTDSELRRIAACCGSALSVDANQVIGNRRIS